MKMNDWRILKFIFLLLIDLLSLIANANDSIKIKTPIFIKEVGIRPENNYYVVEGKNITVPFPESVISLFHWLVLD
jgi:hypothetical protein